MTSTQIEIVKHYQNMQREFYNASVRAMEFPYLGAARLFQREAALYYAMIERLTIEKPWR